MALLAGPIRDVGFDELSQALADETVTLIDVREPHEFDSGCIPGSLSMPLSSFQPSAVPVGGVARVVFSCAAGVRSAQAIAICQAAGLDLREHFAGGFKGWVAYGGPIEHP